ncbi:MAG: YmdB family metallophosphoesterase, partial [Mycoplasmoidaceae bacterium]
MKILFIGDISGEDGIRAIKENVKKIIKKERIDYVIANAENTTDGRGLNFIDYKKLMDYGINFFTMGNHT